MNIHQRDKQGRTILHIAAQIGDINAIRKILATKTDPNVTFYKYNAYHTPLSWANVNLSNNQIYDVAKVLVEANADVNLPREESPLYGAMIRNNFEMVKYYIFNGADTEIVDYPFTPGTIDLKILRWAHEVSEYNDFQRACVKRDHQQLKNLFHNRVFDNGKGNSTAAAIALYPDFCTTLYSPQEIHTFKHDKIAQIMLNALKPWSPQTHYLWDPQSREIVVTLHLICRYIPKEIINNIISYALFRKK